MDILPDEQFACLNRSETNSPLALMLLGFIQKVIGFFVMTEEEKVQAGIDLGEPREIPDDEKITIQAPLANYVNDSGRVA